MNKKHAWLLSMTLPLLALGCQQGSPAPETADAATEDASTVVASPAIADAQSPQVKQVADSSWATLKGRFVFDGKAPERAKVNVTRDAELCGKFDLRNEEVIVGPDGGIANIFVWVSLKKKDRAKLRIHPDYEAEEDATVRLTNKDCRYEPFGVVLRTGQKLELGNDDPVAHNVNLMFRSNTASNQIIPPGSSSTLDNVTKPEKLPAAAKCDIHPWMAGRVMVLDHPYAAVTAEDGTFEIKNLPAGEDLTFRIWHEKGYVQEVEIDGKPEKWKSGRLKENLEGGETDLGDIVVNRKMFEK